MENLDFREGRSLKLFTDLDKITGRGSLSNLGRGNGLYTG